MDGIAIVRDEADRLRFLALLAQTAKRYVWDCYAFCLMTNHYHLVLETTRPLLSAAFHRLNALHARVFNARHERKGHLFGDRFWSSLVETEEHVVAACRYVVLNPVRAALCVYAHEWRWS